MKKYSIILFALIVSASSGCSMYHISSEETSTSYYPSKTTLAEVEYVTEIQRPHEVIGYVIVNAERRQKINEVIDKMKREAAVLGGDVITNIQTDATGEWKVLPGQEILKNAYVRSNFKGMVAVIK